MINASIQKSNLNKWQIFIIVAVGVFMSTLDGSIVNLALPVLMDTFAAPLTIIEWVMMIYLLVVSSLLLSFGRLSDIKGRRWVYTRGLIIFSAGSFCCGAAGSAMWLIGARAVQGVGAAMIMSCTQAILAETFPPEERGTAFGYLGAVVASGLTAGPALGGWLLHAASWQMIFYINIPIGLITAIFAFRLLKAETAGIKAEESFDLIGAALFAAAIGTLLFIITHGAEWSKHTLLFSALIAVCIFSAAGLIFTCLRFEQPLFNPFLLKIRLFTLPVLSAMILFSSLFSIVFLMPFYLIHPCGLPPNKAGYIMMVLFVFLFIFAPVSGALYDRLGSRILCTLGMVILTGALYSLACLPKEFSSFEVIWRLAVGGIGIAIFTPPNNAVIMGAVPPRYIGIAAGTAATVRNLGMVLGIAMAGSIFNSSFSTLSGGLSLHTYSRELNPFFMDAFHFTLINAAVVSGIGVIVAFLRGSEKSHEPYPN